MIYSRHGLAYRLQRNGKPITFTDKEEAQEYAKSLKSQGIKARIEKDNAKAQWWVVSDTGDYAGSHHEERPENEELRTKLESLD